MFSATTINHQARGEMARLALIIGKIPFEDDRITFDKWPALKPNTPLGSVPVAQIDGKEYVQTMALTRYFGKVGGLYPTCAKKALMIDQVVETVMDMQNSLFYYKGTEKNEDMKNAREIIIKVDGSRYWGGCEKMLETISSGPFVLGDVVSIADICITGIYLFLKCEYLDFVCPKALDGYPRMHKVFRSVMAIPEVAEWYQTHPIKNL